MVNPIVTDPNLSIFFPGVTQPEMTALLAEAQKQGAKVIEVTPGDVSLDDVTYRKLIWIVEVVCYWDEATGLTVQIPDAKYRGIIESQITAALAKIREAA